MAERGAKNQERKGSGIVRSTYRSFFWTTYDNLGKVILFNITWFLLCLPLFFILAWRSSFPPFLFYPFLLLAIFLVFLATVGTLHIARILVDNKDAKYLEFFKSFRLHLKKSVITYLVDLVLFTALPTSFLFYFQRASTLGWVSYLLDGLIFWALFFLILVHVYLLPLLTHEDMGMGKLWKNSILLAIDNLFFTIFVLIQVGVLTILSVVLTISVVVLTTTMLAIFLQAALRSVLRRYGIGVEKGEEGEVKRGWRDIIMPWRM